MASSRSALAARMASVSRRTVEPVDRETGTPEDRSTGVPEPRTKPVKLAVELLPADHRDFKAWLHRAERETGMPSVRGMAVLRALVAELLADEQLGERVRRRVAADRS